MVKYFIVKWT